MTMSKDQMQQLIEEYKVYVNKIINHTYFCADPETKEELCQVGLIGLWKGIIAYYKKDRDEFDRKEFVDTICAYIRYEMADFFYNITVIRISGKQWRNFVEIRDITKDNPEISEERLKGLVKASGLRYDWYIKTKEMINLASLDSAINDEHSTNKYNFIPHYDHGIKRFIDRAYIDYIIDSAFAGIKSKRDRELLCTWIDSIYNDAKIAKTDLAQLYGLSPSMVGVIIDRFIGVCCFVRDCEIGFQNNPNGYVDFPEIKENSIINEKNKIPGVKWVLRNRKWKVEITVGKNSSIFIGYFENYQDAVRARRDAELKYRGKSDIEV